MSARHPRRRRDSPPQNILAAPAATPLRLSARRLLLLFATLPSDTQKRYSGYADALLAYEKDVSRDCKGGAAGGCLEEERPAPASGARPKAGQAPKELEAALAAAAGGETSPPPAPEPWSPPPYKPARGSFAEMAGRY